jgi:glycosyltransferase involved in cell wall biosynthesis
LVGVNAALSQLRIVATVNVYNEADIIDQLLTHLDDQGLNYVVLDGGSEDGSIELAKQHRGKGLLEHRTVTRESITLRKDLDCSLEMARKYDPDWIIRNDADEFLEAPNSDMTLAEGIARENSQGYNLIQFNNFEFGLTEHDLSSTENDVRKKLRFYTYSDSFRYKAWKHYPNATDRETGGHYPVFPRGVSVNLSPRKFIMKHYRFRSPEQAMNRIFKDRLPRYSQEERASKRWHLQYDGFKTDPGACIVESKRLVRDDKQNEWDLTVRHNWYPGNRFHTREEILLLLKIQEKTGLLASSCVWKFLGQAKLVKEQAFPASTGRNAAVQRALLFLNYMISSPSRRMHDGYAPLS